MPKIPIIKAPPPFQRKGNKLITNRKRKIKPIASISTPLPILPTYTCPTPKNPTSPSRIARSAAFPGFFDSVTVMIGATGGAGGADDGAGGRMLVLSLHPQLGEYWVSVETSFLFSECDNLWVHT